jgi:pimeloyl-ACP methyl ester carboxylesterase
MKALLLALMALAGGQPATESATAEGRTPAGARWVAEYPANWNGTLLLWSRGYGSSDTVATAPRGTRELLLGRGYALAGTEYSAPGWAVEEAVPDQIATLKAVSERFGRPRRVIAWGASMGGLVTIALAERHPDRFVGALSSCGSIGGSIGMMNMALDGAFAFKTLLGPDSAIRVVGIDDDRLNAARVRTVLDAAQRTPAGRARVALAAALAGLPHWMDPRADEPADDDHSEQQRQAAAAFVFGTFLPRVDQEKRAGGVFSWNDGIDYYAQLQASGRYAHVGALYREAGLDLEADLDRLNAAPRIAADPQAVAYMRDNYVPSGQLRIPVLSYHEIGDGATSGRLQTAYQDIVHRAGQDDMFRAAWVRRAGHCGFAAAEHLAALEALETRIADDRWRTSPEHLNALAGEVGESEGRFTRFRPPPPLRPCSASERICR